MRMPIISNIERKELALFFAAPIGYLFIAVFLAFTLFTFFWGEAFFARNIANRVFARFFGRGIVDPVDDVPARSSNPGRRPRADGGKPRLVGISPAARPISRWATAKRVTESISRFTWSPVSRKCSAIRVAA